MSTGILGCVWGLGNVITIKEPTFLKFELNAESFKVVVYSFPRPGVLSGPAYTSTYRYDANSFCIVLVHPRSHSNHPGRPLGRVMATWRLHFVTSFGAKR